MSFSPIPMLIDEIRQGKMVVLMDDEDRENEGDLIMAAERVTPWHINFMARYARGLICLALTPEHCQYLQLPLMVQNNQSAFGTNFTVSIEAASGVTTGISAHDRAHTILTAVSPQVRASDLVRPGHIFPIRAHPDGVIGRQGHTEASVELAAMAGFSPAGVMCEILNEDGSMARREALMVFAKQHGLKVGTVAELLEYRMKQSNLIESLATI